MVIILFIETVLTNSTIFFTQLFILFIPIYNMNYINLAYTVVAASLGFILWPLIQVR